MVVVVGPRCSVQLLVAVVLQFGSWLVAVSASHADFDSVFLFVFVGACRRRATSSVHGEVWRGSISVWVNWKLGWSSVTIPTCRTSSMLRQFLFFSGDVSIGLLPCWLAWSFIRLETSLTDRRVWLMNFYRRHFTESLRVQFSPIEWFWRLLKGNLWLNRTARGALKMW